jgi:hypothetical protein
MAFGFTATLAFQRIDVPWYVPLTLFFVSRSLGAGIANAVRPVRINGYRSVANLAREISRLADELTLLSTDVQDLARKGISDDG